MKKTILILAFAGTVVFAKAQTIQAPANGYWVIESSKQTPKENLVKFYNTANVLVYQEKITGKKVRINHKHTRQVLNSTLQLALNGKLHNEPILATELSK